MAPGSVPYTVTADLWLCALYEPQKPQQSLHNPNKCTAISGGYFGKTYVQGEGRLHVAPAQHHHQSAALQEYCPYVTTCSYCITTYTAQIPRKPLLSDDKRHQSFQQRHTASSGCACVDAAMHAHACECTTQCTGVLWGAGLQHPNNQTQRQNLPHC